MFKKVLLLVLMFLVSSYVYAGDDKCIGPFDSSQVQNNYKSIVNEFFKTKLDPCQDEDMATYWENNLLQTYFLVWSIETCVKEPGVNSEKRKALLKLASIYKFSINDISSQIQNADPDCRNYMRNKNLIKCRRYTIWNSTQPKIEAYFKSRPELKKICRDAIKEPAKGEKGQQKTSEYDEKRKDLTDKEWLEKGHSLMVSGNHKAAIDAFSKSIELNPENADAYYNRGFVYGDLGNQNQAVIDYSKAIELDPKNSMAYYNRGLAYRKLDNHQQAVIDFSKAIELNPKDSDAYVNRGSVYSDIGNHKQAIKDYDVALQINPQNAMAYYNRGLAYRKLGNHQQAVIDFSKAIELNPKDSDAYVNRGYVYRKLGNRSQAVIDFSKAIELDPKNSGVYARRALCYINLKDYQAAIKDYDKSIELDPKSSSSHNNRGYLYFDMHDYNAAIRDFKMAIELSKDGRVGDTYIGLAISYYQLKDDNQSKLFYNKAIEAEPLFKEKVSEWEKAGYSYSDFQKEVINKIEKYNTQ